MHEAIDQRTLPVEADGLAAAAQRAEAWAGEPFLRADEDAAEALAEGRARELYELAAELLEPRNPNRFLIDVYSRLADIAESEGRKEEAYELMKKAVGMQKAVADAAPS